MPLDLPGRAVRTLSGRPCARGERAAVAQVKAELSDYADRHNQLRTIIAVMAARPVLARGEPILLSLVCHLRLELASNKKMMGPLR